MSHIVFLTALAVGFSPLLAAHAQSPGNVDTGLSQLQCIDAGSQILVRCDTSSLIGQDGQLGRDADIANNTRTDGLLGSSFTKICNTGEKAGEGTCPIDPVLGAAANEWACTLDNLTGMIWEIKTNSGPRSKWRRYTNYSRDHDPLGLYRSETDAFGFLDRVNRDGLCGANDWSLGHSSKIQTMLHYGGTGTKARIDPRYFPNTLAQPYWNGSPNPSRADTAWAIDLATGFISNDGDRGLARPVRVVRGKAAFGGSDGFTFSADGSEANNTTAGAAITWRRCVEGAVWAGNTCTGTAQLFTPEQALAHAVAQTEATGVAWHVPNVKEMNWLIRRENSPPPATDDIAFPQTPVGNFCTSTPDVSQPANVWVIDFEFGRVFTAPRATPCLLRLAR